MARPRELSDPIAGASFTLTVPIVVWIDEESTRRGISKAALVREIVTAAMQDSDDDATDHESALTERVA
ncbi:MAG: hypothetical protein ACR2OO_16745 [Thermomicrobiales bacterium]